MHLVYANLRIEGELISRGKARLSILWRVVRNGQFFPGSFRNLQGLSDSQTAILPVMVKALGDTVDTGHSIRGRRHTDDRETRG